MHVSDLPEPFADAVEEMEKTDPGVLRSALVAGVTFRMALEQFMSEGVPVVRKA